MFDECLHNKMIGSNNLTPPALLGHVSQFFGIMLEKVGFLLPT